VNKPGYYQLPSSYEIVVQVPRYVINDSIKNIKFTSKDGVAMSLDGAIIWQVKRDRSNETPDHPDGVKQIALYPGGFNMLKKDVLAY